MLCSSHVVLHRVETDLAKLKPTQDHAAEGVATSTWHACLPHSHLALIGEPFAIILSIAAAALAVTLLLLLPLSQDASMPSPLGAELPHEGPVGVAAFLKHRDVQFCLIGHSDGLVAVVLVLDTVCAQVNGRNFLPLVAGRHVILGRSLMPIPGRSNTLALGS